MTTPAQLRAQAERLREAAQGMRTIAAPMDATVDTLRTRYPHARDGVWFGSAATEFYDLLDTARAEVDTLRQDVAGYAASCESRAGELDREADQLQAALDAPP